MSGLHAVCVRAVCARWCGGLPPPCVPACAACKRVRTHLDTMPPLDAAIFCSMPCCFMMPLSAPSTRSTQLSSPGAAAGSPDLSAVITERAARCPAPSVSGASSTTSTDRRTSADASAWDDAPGRNVTSSCDRCSWCWWLRPDTRHPSIVISSALERSSIWEGVFGGGVSGGPSNDKNNETIVAGVNTHLLEV